jgi:MraZ protein
VGDAGEIVGETPSVYYGEAYTSVDDKGRVNVPKEFRLQMEARDHDTWFVTRGFDGSLFLFEKTEWEKLLEKARAKAAIEPKMLDFRRFLLGSASKIKVDAQGRLSVPAPLREYADIDREAVLLGVEDHLELWNKENWRAFQKAQLENYKSMAAELFGAPAAAAAVAV